MSPLIRASGRPAIGPGVMKPKDKTQRTRSLRRLRHSSQDNVPVRSEGSPDGTGSDSDEVSSPRSRVGALSKDETFIGLIIVTALVSTNRFLQKLSGLMNSMSTTSDSSETVSSGSSRVQTPPPASASAVPTAVMNLTLQPDIGETHISLSSANPESGPQLNEQKDDPQYPGFFNVAASAVKGVMTDNSQTDSWRLTEGTAAASSTSGLADAQVDVEDKQSIPQAEESLKEPRKWIPASVSRDPSRGGRDHKEAGTFEDSKDSKSVGGPDLQQRPGGRRSLGLEVQCEGGTTKSSGPSPSVFADAGSDAGTSKASVTESTSSLQRPGGRRPFSTHEGREDMAFADKVSTPVFPASAGFAAASAQKDHQLPLNGSNQSAATPITSSKEDSASPPAALGGRSERGIPPSSTSTVAQASTNSSTAGKTGSLDFVPSASSVSSAAHVDPRAPDASVAEKLRDRIWPQPPPPLGGGSGSGSNQGGGRGGSGSSGGGDDEYGEDDGSSGGRFPWVPVLLFMLAASTYPILRDATESNKQRKQSGSTNPFAALLAGLVSFADKLLQPLRAQDSRHSALRTAQQDAYAAKVAEHQPGSENGQRSLAGMLPGARNRLPKSWGGPVSKSVGENEKQQQRWRLIVPLMVVAGIVGYAWIKSRTGTGGDSSSATLGSSDKETSAAVTSLTDRTPALASSAHFSSTDVTGQTPQQKELSSAYGSRPSPQGHDEHLDPRHLSQEVSELHEKLVQRDIEYSTLAKHLAELEHQEASLRAASTADTQAVRKQIAEMRNALRESDMIDD